MKCLKGKLNIERNAWKILIDFENYEQDKDIIPRNLMKEKKDFLESQRKKLCFEVINDCKIFEENIDEKDFSAKIFYLKLKADYLRYYGETASEEEFEKYKDTCREAYENAFQLCKQFLEPTDLLYLSVTLNYSVFLYTLTDETSNAYNIANDTYKQAIVKLLPEKKNPEVENILKSIEENIEFSASINPRVKRCLDEIHQEQNERSRRPTVSTPWDKVFREFSIAKSNERTSKNTIKGNEQCLKMVFAIHMSGLKIIL